MRKYGLLFLLFIASVTGIRAQKFEVWMVGPMLHFNFSDKKLHTSLGIEVAYWNYNKFPYSIDGGIEFERGKFRIYSEAQTGVGFCGVSLGPVIEYNKVDIKLNLGIQGSVWGNYFGGIDLRYRNVGGNSTLSPGMYFKLPLGYVDTDGDTDGEHDDWDWDD